MLDFLLNNNELKTLIKDKVVALKLSSLQHGNEGWLNFFRENQ